MKNLTKTLLVAPLLMMPISNAHAQTSGVVPFLGSVDPVCSLVVDNGGTLTSNAGGTVLGSKENGGSSGKITVQSNTSDLSLNVQAPTSFSNAPATGGDNVTFDAEATLAGLGGVGGGILAGLIPGDQEFDIDLTATKSTGTFVSGDYAADVTVTCE